MTRKSLRNAAHASELKRSARDGGRGAERLRRRLSRRPQQITSLEISSEYENKTIIRAELDQRCTNQTRGEEDGHEGLVGCERLHAATACGVLESSAMSAKLVGGAHSGC